MDADSVFERWREQRAQLNPSPDFPDRVMARLDANPSPGDPMAAKERSWRLAKAVLCAAAALAALIRVMEVLSLFRATGIEN